MTLKDILVISGQGGLYKYVSQSRNKVIVENLSDQKRSNISSTAKISVLEDIAIFTEEGDVPLRHVFKNIQVKENGASAMPHKSPDQDVRNYFATALPEYDRDKVYLSDMRKILMWYNLLVDLEINDFEALPEPSEVSEPAEDKQE